MLVLGARDRPEFELWDSPLQVVVGLMMLAAALGATVMRNRLAAVLLVGVTGYGCGVDLRVPRRTRPGADPIPGGDTDVGDLRAGAADAARRGRRDQTSGATDAARAAGASRSVRRVTTLAAFAMAARTTTPIAELLPDAAYYRGHGSNTVNVLLVDIRAWDTIGEISVLLVAATGVASMVFRHSRFGAAPRVVRAGQPDIGRIPCCDQPAVGDITWLRGSELRDPRYRSLVLEVATRLIFPLIMVLSVYFFFAGHNTPAAASPAA